MDSSLTAETMALQERLRVISHSPPDTRTLQNQPSSAAETMCDDPAAEADEPPDDRNVGFGPERKKSLSSAPEFKKTPYNIHSRSSLLTKSLHTTESEVDEDDSPFFPPTRSSLSNHSRGSVASTAELTSDGGHTSPARTGSPSPPTPPTLFRCLPSIFNTKPSDTTSTMHIDRLESIAPLQKVPKMANEVNVEATLGRKRCITFACGNRAEHSKPKEDTNTQTEDTNKSSLPRRPSVLKFVCPTRDGTTASRPHTRLGSPPPPVRQASETRPHRGSDSTVRNSPKMVRRPTPAVKESKESVDSDVGRTEATRFHEFASSEDEIDEWTQESTCHRRRLTVDDTLTVENRFRRLGAEVEEEEEEESAEEAALDDEDDDEDDDDGEDDGVDESSSRDSLGEESDEGFQTDDEGGFAGSDNESDGGSEFEWWAPGGKRVGMIGHKLPATESHASTSTESADDRHVFPGFRSPKNQRQKTKPREIRGPPPELPDSTDFVCGTLDEDKPLEQAYRNHLDQRRAAKHRRVPQDIDPTFPTSDPEMDEEDEDSEHDEVLESDNGIFLHGDLELYDDGDNRHRRMIPKKRSPIHSPKRLRSPPPAKRVSIHRSPPPPRRLRSPPPTACGAPQNRLSASVPRNRPCGIRATMAQPPIEEDDTENTPRGLPLRGAIDIVKGLEKKRQRRSEKMCERHNRRPGKGKDRKPPPGKGAERMREMGLELNACRGRKNVETRTQDEVHMLSF